MNTIGENAVMLFYDVENLGKSGNNYQVKYAWCVEMGRGQVRRSTVYVINFSLALTVKGKSTPVCLILLVPYLCTLLKLI